MSEQIWWKSKTIWAGTGAVLTAIGAYLSGEMAAAQAIQTGFTGLIGIFLRLGLLKN